MSKDKIDIAIVGGGVSGVYCAWRLQQTHPEKKIVVFEASDHIGGRLLSVRPPHIKNMVAELGGMRILPKVQPLIKRLLEVLNQELPADHQIETYDFPVDKPQNIAYLRGTHLRLADFTANPDKVPYQLTYQEQGQASSTILVQAIEQIVPGITDESLTDDQRRNLARNAIFAGRPLYQQGFWNVLSRVISGEAYQLGVDMGGYSTVLSNWNAADAIPWFLSDFGISPDYKGFKNGFQQVPNSLGALFRSGDDQKIQLNMPLKAFEWKNGHFELQFQGKTIHAGSLILAMPRRSLDLLTTSCPLLQEPKVRNLVTSVTPRPLFKIFTTYTNPWWLSAGVQSGRTVTDLPIRQTYYWPKDDGKPATSGPAMLMASYDDGANIGFWDGLRPRRHLAWKSGQEVIPPAHPHGCPDDSLEWHKYCADENMVTEVARQLAAIHGLSYTPEVRSAAFRDWGDDPFGGGWNSWNIGVESSKVKEEIIQPISDHPLYICGEAYSDAQGWVEGALQTADMLLEKFGIRPL